MAIAVIGGLIISTVLSLLFVPAVFTLLDDVGRLSWRLVSGFIGETDEPHETSGERIFPTPVFSASREEPRVAAE
jgi:hypothetical protein